MTIMFFSHVWRALSWSFNWICSCDYRAAFFGIYSLAFGGFCRAKNVALSWLSLQSKPSRTVTVQLYCPQETEQRKYIIDELTRNIQQQIFEIGNLRINVVLCESPSSIDGLSPLIVICVHSSRLGTDFNNALMGVEGRNNVAVLVCHHNAEHSLPDEPSKSLLRETGFAKVEAIIDTAFLFEKGWYDCSMNRKAYQDLKSFLEAN